MFRSRQLNFHYNLIIRKFQNSLKTLNSFPNDQYSVISPIHTYTPSRCFSSMKSDDTANPHSRPVSKVERKKIILDQFSNLDPVSLSSALCEHFCSTSTAYDINWDVVSLYKNIHGEDAHKMCLYINSLVHVGSVDMIRFSLCVNLYLNGLSHGAPSWIVPETISDHINFISSIFSRLDNPANQSQASTLVCMSRLLCQLGRVDKEYILNSPNFCNNNDTTESQSNPNMNVHDSMKKSLLTPPDAGIKIMQCLCVSRKLYSLMVHQNLTQYSSYSRSYFEFLRENDFSVPFTKFDSVHAKSTGADQLQGMSIDMFTEILCSCLNHASFSSEAHKIELLHSIVDAASIFLANPSVNTSYPFLSSRCMQSILDGTFSTSRYLKEDVSQHQKFIFSYSSNSNNSNNSKNSNNKDSNKNFNLNNACDELMSSSRMPYCMQIENGIIKNSLKMVKQQLKATTSSRSLRKIKSYSIMLSIYSTINLLDGILVDTLCWMLLAELLCVKNYKHMIHGFHKLYLADGKFRTAEEQASIIDDLPSNFDRFANDCIEPLTTCLHSLLRLRNCLVVRDAHQIPIHMSQVYQNALQSIGTILLKVIEEISKYKELRELVVKNHQNNFMLDLLCSLSLAKADLIYLKLAAKETSFVLNELHQKLIHLFNGSLVDFNIHKTHSDSNPLLFLLMDSQDINKHPTSFLIYLNKIFQHELETSKSIINNNIGRSDAHLKASIQECLKISNIGVKESHKEEFMNLYNHISTNEENYNEDSIGDLQANYNKFKTFTISENAHILPKVTADFLIHNELK